RLKPPFRSKTRQRPVDSILTRKARIKVIGSRLTAVRRILENLELYREGRLGPNGRSEERYGYKTARGSGVTSEEILVETASGSRRPSPRRQRRSSRSRPYARSVEASAMLFKSRLAI